VSDERTRDLERRAAADPLAQEALEREWIRSGLGWAGEEIKEGSPIPVTNERRVYRHHGIQLVRVPGGRTECSHYLEPGRAYTLPSGVTIPVPPESGGVEVFKDQCPNCKGTEVRQVAPFFLGRFPVTWREWFATPDPEDGTVPWTSWLRSIESVSRLNLHEDDRPVTSVTLDEAGDFCWRVHMRLMTADEWEWAVWGGLEQRVCAHCDGKGETWEAGGEKETYGPCPACWRGGAIWDETVRGPRPTRRTRYPWGDEEPDQTRCVRPADMPEPVVDATGRPARDAGKSWCLVHDLTGNVSQIVMSDGPLGFAIMGGSFRSSRPMDPHYGIAFGGRRPMDHVGFRAALSIPA
jgi:hypothetical protein